MADPIASIVVPTFNRAELLGRSLRSLLAQTEGRFEVLVVDDASQDHTRQIVEGLGDRRIRYLLLESNRGPAAARNAGVAMAKSDVLGFHDSDDECEPEKLARQLKALDESGAGVVSCDLLRVLLSGKTIYLQSPAVKRNRWIDPQTLFYQSFGLGIQSALIRRDAFEKVGGFDEQLRCFEDLEIFLRLAQVVDFHHLEEPLVRYYESGGLTTGWHQEWKGRRRILSVHGEALRQECPAFCRAERRVLLGRRMLGPLARRWLGRPVGPPQGPRT